MAKASKTTPVKKSLYTIDPLLKKKMKYIAAMDEENPDQTKIINKALDEFISKWEKANHKIPIKQP